MQPFHQNSPKRKQFISIISLLGIAVVGLLFLLTIPVEYQLLALLYANQNGEPILKGTVLLLIASGIIAMLSPTKTAPVKK